MRATRIARSAIAVLATVAAAVMVVAPLVAEAQTAPRAGSYRPGPDAAGNNTYIGRIEAPRATGLRLGADLLVAGWFVDTTAAGWAGADKGEVWLGNMGQGTKLADLAVGQPRADIRDALGAADWTNSGFTGTIPASTLAQVPGGNQTLNVYLHTPNKGWWFKSAVVNIPSTVGLQFPNDPIVFFVQPQQGQVVDQFAQPNSRFSLRGVALDRNPVTDPSTQSAGAEHTGVDRVQIYIDGPRGTGTLLGNAGLAGGIGVNNKTGVPGKTPGACCFNTGAAAENTTDFSLLGLGFGQQFELASFSLGWNPTTVPEGKHSVWAYARSSITGKENVATVDFILQRIHCSSIGGTCQ